MISVPPYLVAIIIFKYLLPQYCVTTAPHAFSDLSIKVNKPMNEQVSELGRHGMEKDNESGDSLQK